MPAAVARQLKIYDDDFSTLVATIASPKAASWIDTKNDVGSGKLTLKQGDANLAALVPGRVVRVEVEGVDRYGWIIDEPEMVLVSSQEKAGQLTEVSGKGIGSCMSYGCVLPVLGYNRYPFSDDRTMNAGSSAFDISAWVDAGIMKAEQRAVGTFWNGLPAGFPGLTVSWIGPPGYEGPVAAPVGHVYLIYDFTLADDTTISFFLGADNRATVFVDTILLAEVGDPNAGTTEGFVTTHRVEMFLSAGTHRLFVDLRNTDFDGAEPGTGAGPVLTGNPTGFICDAWRTDPTGQLFERLFSSDDTWQCLAYPADTPGLTVGQILTIFVAEAQADGELGPVTLNFTGSTDSGGSAFPQLPSFTCKINTDLQSVLNAMTDAGYIDWWMSPAGELSVWVSGGRGVPSGVTFTAGTNLTELRERKRDVVADALLVRWSGGWIRYPSSGGSRLGALSAPVSTIAEAEAIAASVSAINGAVRTELKASIAALSGHVPYVNFDVCDGLTVAGSSEQCTQIGGTFHDSFGVVFSALFRDVLATYDDRLARIVKQMSNGILMGSTRVASPASAPPKLGEPVRDGEVTFQFSDPPADDTTTADKILSRSSNIFAIAVTAKTPASGDTAFEFLVDGTDILSGTGVLPGGSTFVLLPVAVAPGVQWCVGNSSRLWAHLTTVGTPPCSGGLTGLIIEPRFA